jgi:hypothetical protein
VRKLLSPAPVFLFTCIAAVQTGWASDEISFQRVELQPGSSVRQTVHANLIFYGKGALRVSMDQVREAVLMDKDGLVKVHYGDLATTSNVPEVKGGAAPVARQSYLLKRTSEAASATDLIGKPVPEDEKAFLADDISRYLKPNPIALLLTGRTLAIGDELGDTNSLASIIEERLSPLGVGKVEELKVKLIGRQKFRGQDTAIFWVNVYTSESELIKSLQANLTGQLVVEIPSGLPIAFKLSGTVSAAGVADDSETREGSLNLNVFMQRKTVEPKKQETWVRENEVFQMGGGRGVRAR